MSKLAIFIALLLLSACSSAISVSESEVEGAIRKSDDFAQYSKPFIAATMELVKSKKCTIAELEEQGGWLKSTLNHKAEPVYFTYCGGMERSNRIYLNVVTQQIFMD